MKKWIKPWSRVGVFTSDDPETMRYAVDVGETSFEEGRQFRFYDEFHENSPTGNISDTDILVYKFTTVNPVNITNRTLDMWSGGRTYQVFPDDGNVTFSGTLVDQTADKVHKVNQHAINDYETTVTVSRYIGTGGFTYVGEAVNGTSLLASTSGNRRSSTYAQSGAKGGVGEAVSFYLVLKHISDTNLATKGSFTLEWEEIFPEEE